MTVRELKEELKYYDDDANVIFELDDEVEVETITESKYGWRTAHVDSELRPSFIGEIHGDMRIELEVQA